MNQGRTDFVPVLFPNSLASCPRPRARSRGTARRLRLDRHDPAGDRRLVFAANNRNAKIHDVICGGMYRACSTWQYEVVGHLVESHLQGERLGYLTGESYATGFSLFSRSDIHVDIGGRSWRVLKSHEGHRCFARALCSGRALAVYTYRDIRDVVFSLMHKRGLTFEELLRQGIIHQILINDRFWRAQPRVLIQRYEEIVADPVTAVVQLARHLGLGVTRREAAQIADDYSLQSNQMRIEALRRRLENAGIDLSSPGNLQICDPVTLLHWNHLRPGGCGSWQADFRLSQRVLLDRLCGAWLRTNGYGSELEPASPARKAGYAAGVGLRDELAMAVGRVTSWLRRVAGHCPRTAKRVRQFLGLADSNLEPVFSWSSEVVPQGGDLAQRDDPRARGQRGGNPGAPTCRLALDRTRSARDVWLVAAVGYFAVSHWLRGYSCRRCWAYSSARPSCLSRRKSFSIWKRARGCSCLSLL